MEITREGDKLVIQEIVIARVKSLGGRKGWGTELGWS
jgi:hypothetical protein